MNKYHDALCRIIDEYIPMHYEGKPMNQQTEDALTLQELVDKATPKKPIYRIPDLVNPFREPEELAHCPNCNWQLNYHYGCQNNNCRQAIDWSNDE